MQRPGWTSQAASTEIQQFPKRSMHVRILFAGYRYTNVTLIRLRHTELKRILQKDHQPI